MSWAIGVGVDKQKFEQMVLPFHNKTHLNKNFFIFNYFKPHLCLMLKTAIPYTWGFLLIILAIQGLRCNHQYTCASCFIPFNGAMVSSLYSKFPFLFMAFFRVFG